MLSIPSLQESFHVTQPPEPASLGERIAHQRRLLGVRLRRDVTPADLAGMLGVSPPTVYRWESGEKSPREDALTAMAKLFEVTPAYLRYGIAPPRPGDQWTPEALAKLAPAPAPVAPRRVAEPAPVESFIARPRGASKATKKKRA